MTAIVIDTSALMGLLLQESDAEALLDAAARAAVVRLSAASRLELALVAESARHGIEATEVEQLLLALRVEVMPLTITNCTGPWKAGAATAKDATRRGSTWATASAMAWPGP